MTDLEQKFKLAVKYIQSMPKDAPHKPSQDELLEFYSLFKQATEGPNKTKKPSRINMVAKAKWFYALNSNNFSNFFFFGKGCMGKIRQHFKRKCYEAIY